MPYFTRKQRFKIALGGFVSFVGFAILIFTLLAVTGTMNFESIIQPNLLVGVLAVIGILDILVGILLLRSK
jgi:hypothetical protein